MTPEQVLIPLAASMLGSAVTGGLVLWANQRLFGWRIHELEERMEPLDRSPNSALTRLTRLETRQAHRR